MNEHLPECPVEKRLRAGRTVGSQTCICGALRTCEERVRESEACLAVCADLNYQRGLDKAREAVAALATERELRSPSGLEIDIHEALSAIDALGKEDE